MKLASTICPKCGTISDADIRELVACSFCHFEISHKDYKKLLDFGAGVIRYGIHYRRQYEDDLAKHGKLPIRYSLADPSVVLSFIGVAIAGGIIGNAAYDGVKICLGRLATALKSRKLTKNTISVEQPFAVSNDLDILFRLIGEDDEYANQFVADIQDYINGMPNAHPDVKAVIIQEETIHRSIDAVLESLKTMSQTTKTRYVYITPSGACYHNRNCPQLRSNPQRLSVRKAMEKYKPCKACIDKDA